MPEAFEVIIPRAVQREVETLAGKRTGYADARRRLGVDPCQTDLGAYRLSGPLHPIVCGLHLKWGYRLAFSTQPSAPAEGAGTSVVILYVGRRHAGLRSNDDVWDVLHELFGIENPPAGHRKPACCDGGMPQIGDDELAAFLVALRRAQRGR